VDLPFEDAVARQLVKLDRRVRPNQVKDLIADRREEDVRRALAHTRQTRPQDTLAHFKKQLGGRVRPCRPRHARAWRRWIGFPTSRTDPTVKLAHLADLHLGFRQYDRQTPRAGISARRTSPTRFRRAVDDLLEQRPDLILVAGDVFHSVRPTNRPSCSCFSSCTGCGPACPTRRSS